MSEVTHAIKTGKGIGQRLMQQREACALTKEMVAKELRLPQRVIDALEQEQFEAHPGLMFMRGYLRAYCRLLKLPLDEIMQDFAALGLETTTGEININSFLERKSSTFTERYWHWILGVVAISLLSLMLVWWHGHRSTIEMPMKQKLVKVDENEQNKQTEANIAPHDISLNSTHSSQSLDHNENSTSPSSTRANRFASAKSEETRALDPSASDNLEHTNESSITSPSSPENPVETSSNDSEANTLTPSNLSSKSDKTHHSAHHRVSNSMGELF